ncbi:MAG: T9SS type A sorting domain-containing protein [Bacteroidetes bacterium]|nr:T9SS type A sorting domain-containing protein [Bacteroidota bacterium]
MRLRHVLMTGLAALTFSQANAQAWITDSITMGAGYTNDVFYSLKNGAQLSSTNTNWHIAFQTTPPGPYGNVSVFANHVQANVKVFALHLRAATNFATLSPTDTIGKTGDSYQLTNSDSNWNYGAFNMNYNQSNAFDYGWGTYDMTSHNVNGDSLFLVTVTNNGNTDAYKLWIKRYVSQPVDSIQWQFRIAKFDGTADTTMRIYQKANYSDRLFAYLSLPSYTVTNREPSRTAWDILFTRYKEYMLGSPGVPYYNVMGVLANFEVEAAQKLHVGTDDTMGYRGFVYSSKLSNIGASWKSFDMNLNKWVIADSNYYFVKSKNTNEIYQLKFTGFGGTGTGKVVFQKRLLSSGYLAITSMPVALQSFRVAPNPAYNDVSILIDAKETTNARLMISDLNGRVVYNTSVTIMQGLNATTFNTSNVASGLYLITLTNGAWKVTEKLSVQH